MATDICTQIEINTPSQKVWAILTDFSSYPHWNPFIKSLEGNAMVGNRLVVKFHAPDSGVMIFKPKVLAYQTEKEIRWLGHLFFPGLFDGEHRFELVDNKNGTTTFVQSERFTGILVPLFKKVLENNTKRGFVLMNEKLKTLAENS